jgi:predicted enzyme related to lactoylglutathione lyase
MTDIAHCPGKMAAWSVCLESADVADETQEMEGVGRFGWVTDPEGNQVELWQPA